MCMPVSPKNVAANWGTFFETLANSALAAPGGVGNKGKVRPAAIRLVHSRPCRMMKPMPQAMVANSHMRCALALPSTAARTAEHHGQRAG